MLSADQDVALVINTLGVATDLSILAFSTTFVSEDVAGRILMLISSCESSGTLFGVGVLYPITSGVCKPIYPFQPVGCLITFAQ